MSIKSIAAKFFAKKIYHKTQLWAKNPIATQRNVFEDLIRQAKKTQFGIDHHFDQIKTFGCVCGQTMQLKMLQKNKS